MAKEAKINLWVEKMAQLESLQLPEQNLILITSLKKELLRAKEIDNNDNIFDIALKLAQITPENDFYLMFGSLDDYKLNGNRFHDSLISRNLISEIESIGLKFQSRDEKNNKNRSMRATCNCKWTCSFFESSSSQGSNCEVSNGGCGFLWMQDCDSHV